MKRVLTLVTVFMFTIPVFSQKNIILKGIVLDRKDEGVSFAHVGLVDKAVGTVTNENGEFVLNLALITWMIHLVFLQ